MSSTETRTLRDFGLLMGGVIGGLFGLVIPLLKQRAIPWAPWLIALIFAAFALASPRQLGLAYRIWMKFGHILGAINSRIIIGIVFWVIVTPLSFFFRIIRRDVLKLRYKDPAAPSYRVAPAATDPKTGMERPF